MSASRRAFLQSLATLPLIGGSVALIGRPTAVAAGPSYELLDSYKTWLENERRFLSWEMAHDPAVQAKWQCYPQTHDAIVELSRHIDKTTCTMSPAWDYHPSEAGSPSTRAALVLSAVGCDWREG